MQNVELNKLIKGEFEIAHIKQLEQESNSFEDDIKQFEFER
ncbi:unnamed protein product, partial [Rotaria sp. Silwood1]